MRHLIRKTRHRIVGWSLLDICAGLAGLLSATLLSLWLLNKLGVSITAMKSLVLGWLVVGVAFLVLKLRDLLKAFQSFHHLCRFIEDATPAYHNDLSTLDYLQRNMPEVHRYGFSQDLIAALKNSVEHLPEPDWPALGLTWPAHRRPALCAAGGLVLLAVLVVADGASLRQAARQAFIEEGLPSQAGIAAIQLPLSLQVPLNQELVIPSATDSRYPLCSAGQLDGHSSVMLLIREKGRPWRSAGSLAPHEDGGSAPPQPLRLKISGEMQVSLVADGGKSNACTIHPVYPPAIENARIVVTPPAYTRREKQTYTSPARIEAMSGSMVVFSWTTNNDLAQAEAQLLSETGTLLSSLPLECHGKTLATTLQMVENSRLRLQLRDTFDQKTQTADLALFAYPDAIPSAQILSPSRESILGPDLRVPLQVLLRDDVAVSEAWLVHRVETEADATSATSATSAETRQALLKAGSQIPSASTVLASPLLDLATSGLWPGDRVSYWIEVRDWRGPDRPGVIGRSETYGVRFPTVEETMDEKASMRARTADNFQDLIEDQKEISRQFKEMREDIEINRKDKMAGESQWESQKKLEETIKRQEDVQKKIADVARQFEESLKRLEEQNDISLRTLQKFEQVQDLLDQLLSEEAKQILKDLQETLKELEKNELRPEDMEKTEMNLAEFEKQLDRQLSLLQNMWLEHEAEALKEQAEKLADLQEELKKATQELQQEKDPASATPESELESELAETEAAPEKLEDQIDRLIEEVKKQIEEKGEPQLAEASQGQQPPTEAPEAEQKPEKSGEQSSGQTPEQASEQASAESPSENGQSPENGSVPPESTPSQEGSQFAEQEKMLADRQEQLAKETEALLDELKRLQEKANEQKSEMSPGLKQVSESREASSVGENQRSAQSSLKEGNLNKACKKQSKAKKDLDRIASGLGGCCGGQDMEQQIEQMKVVLERSFILSEESENNDREAGRYRSLPTWPNPDSMSRLGREMGFFRQEALRLSSDFKTLSEKNPFADYTVVKHFDQAARNWQENTRIMEESSPMTVSVRSHQALGLVNLAIERLLESLNQSQSQSSSSSSSLESYFRDLKKMLSEQKKLNQDSKSLKEQMQEGNQNSRLPNQEGGQQQDGEGKSEGQQETPGQDGKPGQKGAGDQLQKMAEQQRNIRRQLQELEQQYKNAKGRTGSLEGAGEMMQEVEKELEQNRLNDRVTDLQMKIEQRLLDAEKSMHQKGFKKKRKALRAEGDNPEGEVAEPPESIEPGEPDALARLLRRNLEEVSPEWRERVRAYYDNLLRVTPQ